MPDGNKMNIWSSKRKVDQENINRLVKGRTNLRGKK